MSQYPGQTLPSSISSPLEQPQGIYATNFPAGYLRVTDEPHSLMVDPFDSNYSLDVTNRWVSTSGGGGVAAATASC